MAQSRMAAGWVAEAFNCVSRGLPQRVSRLRLSGVRAAIELAPPEVGFARNTVSSGCVECCCWEQSDGTSANGNHARHMSGQARTVRGWQALRVTSASANTDAGRITWTKRVCPASQNGEQSIRAVGR